MKKEASYTKYFFISYLLQIFYYYEKYKRVYHNLLDKYYKQKDIMCLSVVSNVSNIWQLKFMYF